MTLKTTMRTRLLSIFLCLAMLMAMFPLTSFAAESNSGIHRVADRSTMNDWQKYFFPNGDISTLNAGSIWMDKSVFTDASAFEGTGISANRENSFLVALSAIASNKSVTGMSHIPTDSMLVLDVSGSMNDNEGNNDVAEELVDAANKSIATLLSANKHSRVGVVLYSGSSDSSTNYTTAATLLLPLGRYTTGSDGEYLTYTVTGRNSTTETIGIDSNVTYEGTTNKPTSKSKDVVGATYIQRGIITAMNAFVDEENTIMASDKRMPVVVLMSDGAPSLGSTNFTDPGKNQNDGYNLGSGSGTSAALGFVTQLTAAYAKAKIEEKYGTDALFYTLGLGLGRNDTVALSVMDPDNANGSTAVDDFWNLNRQAGWFQSEFKGYNHIAVGETVSLGNNRSVTKISTPLEQNYVDRYFAASTTNLVEVFESIMSVIQLQSAYFPTLISQNEDLSGYVSFVDRISQYMEVTDVKGILIDNMLFSGADLAGNFVSGGGALGTFDNPSALGHEMVSAVRARLGLDSDDTARTLITLAYQYGQLSYTDRNHFSNYIGWYANAAGQFLGFYHEGVTVLPDPTGNAATDPAFTIKSYGYLGAVDESHGVSKSDMMYATVQVRENIQNGEQLVTFAIPAALIPIVSYEVTLGEDDELTELNASGAEHPIRLVYEVALQEDIHAFNVKEKVSAEYLADPHNINADGSINFYTNQWDHDNTTGYGTINTYSYFNPSRLNDRYYYTEDQSYIYTNQSGTLYTGTTAPTGGTFYRAITVYPKNGNLQTSKVYEPISSESLKYAVEGNHNNWYIPGGIVHTYLGGYYSAEKMPTDNVTGTLTDVNIPFVDTTNHEVNEEGYEFYVGATLGNNGRLTLMPETGIKLSKAMAEGVAAPNEAFTFNIFNLTDTDDNNTYPAWQINADGTEDSIITFNGGHTTVRLNAGETIYIGGMTAGTVIQINEAETAEYVVESVSGLTNNVLTIVNKTLLPVTFVNDQRSTGNLTIAKEVEHDFGQNYSIPADKSFTMTVTLSGIGTANATFKAAKTDSTIDSIQTDADGKFTITLKHDEQFEIFGLPEGTVATVVESTPGTGFAPTYWDSGKPGDGIVTIEGDSTVSVIVVNDYTPAEVYPINITVSGSKTFTGREWTSEDSFTFVLQRYDGLDAQTGEAIWTPLGEAVATSANKSFDFNDAFADERYATAGTYYYRIIEIEPADPKGITYDKTVHSFAVDIGDVNMDGQLEITEVHTSRPDTTVITSSNSGWHVNVGFTNTYSTTGSATVTIDLNKVIDNLGGAPRSLAGFTFGLYDSDNELVGTSLATTDRGFARFVKTYSADLVRDDLVSGKATYHYTLKEIVPSTVPTGWTYSTVEIPVTVVVSDDGDGSISAIIFIGAEEPANAGTSIEATFTNTYDPADAKLNINFVDKQLTGRAFNENDNFTFSITETNVPEGRTPHKTLTGTVGTDDDGDGIADVVFTEALSFTEIGTYFFEIKETSTDGNGITVDKTPYRVTVTVTDVNGQLTASYVLVNATGDTIVFRNTYKAEPTTPHTIRGKKTLNGRVLLNDEFTFVLTELTFDGQAISNPVTLTTHNPISGEFSFPAITYNKPGTYVYTVYEQGPESDETFGIQYDTTSYKVTVVVKDDGKGQLYVDSESVTLSNGGSADGLNFLNQYVPAKTSTQFEGDKELNGRVLGNTKFDFELYASDSDWAKGDLIESVQNDTDGIFAFSSIDFESDEDQYYIVVEKHGGETIDGVTYDNTVYHIWVEITDDLKGQLHAEIHIYDAEGVPQNSILFVNAYAITGTDSVILSGEKTLNGRTWNDDDVFTFELYEADGDFQNLGATPLLTEDVNAQNHIFEMELSYSAEDVGKTFYYVLKELNAGETIGGVSYSTTRYHITVEVTDNGIGGIDAIATVEGATTTTLDFENNYTPSVPPVPPMGNSAKWVQWFTLMTISGGAVLALASQDKKKKRLLK